MMWAADCPYNAGHMFCVSTYVLPVWWRISRCPAFCCNVVSKLTMLGRYLQGEHAQLTLHVFDIELLLDLLRNPAYKAQQVFEKLVAGNMVTGVQVGIRSWLQQPFRFDCPCICASLTHLSLQKTKGRLTSP